MARAIDAGAVKRRAWDIAEAWKDQGRDYEALLLESVVEQIVDTQPTLTPPNEPLTMEELRKMDGEPVWVTSARERGNIPSRWVLFAGVSKSKRNSDVFVFATTGGIAQGYEAVNYGKTWNAYRRPPEGEEET